MPKRGARLPWRMTTTWPHETKPFVEAFYTEDGALGARLRRLYIANRNHDGAGTFVVSNRDDPTYVDSGASHCPFCPLWGTNWVWQVKTYLCADHAEVLEDLLDQDVAP